MTDADRHALQRYVAGLPVDPDALARAVTALAVERTVAVEALLRGLAPDAEPATRLRFARRLQQMDDLDPRLAARLRVMADQDHDRRIQDTAEATLRAHGLSGDQPPPDIAKHPALRFALGLRLVRVMDDEAPVVFEALYGDDAPDLDGELHRDGPDRSRIELHGLPVELVGTRPVLRAARDGGPLVPVAHTDAPVAPDATVTLHADASREDLERWCRDGADLAVLEEPS